ncbi:MAG: UDP-N-acetylglucosamine 2-epimerase [Candidatus Aenigmarchaeota archaeon]|nr:UDP-N-acetylglucosamine 2-epimerase [Candidatus Aenigmarchaeota archaeon]
MALVIIRNEEDLNRIPVMETDSVIVLQPQLAGKIKAKCIVPDFRAASKKALEWMKSWPDKKVNGRSFKELFQYKGLSVWWLMENWLYYSPIYPIRHALETIAAIEPIIRRTKDEVVFVDGSPIAEAINLVAGKRARPVAGKKPNLNLKITAMRIFFDLSYLLRKTAWKVLSGIYRPESGSAGIVLFSVYDWEILRKGGKIVRQDTYIAPLVKCLDKQNIKIIGIPVGRFLGLRNIKDKLLSGMKFNVIENYGYARDEFKQALKLKDMWKQLSSSGNFRKSFRFCGVNIWNIVEKQFDAYFAARWKSHLRDFMLLESLLKTEKPGAVVYPAEMSEFGRELFYLCESAGAKCLAIQHGVFGNWLNVYHTKNELRGKYRCPLPAKTAVYGPAFRDMLVDKCNYPDDSVVITGSQRFDRITDRGQNIRKTLGIASNKKIIALITSPVSRGENAMLTKAVFGAVKKFGNVQLVVKIHPNESSSVYKKAEGYAKSGAIIVRDIDLYDVIRSCDAAITYLSTAGMEAILLGKPLIVVNLTGRDDVVPYVKEKAAIGVYRAEDLEPAIRRALADGTKGLNTKSFMKKYAYKNDGKASERICKLIRGLMN